MLRSLWLLVAELIKVLYKQTPISDYFKSFEYLFSRILLNDPFFMSIFLLIIVNSHLRMIKNVALSKATLRSVFGAL